MHAKHLCRLYSFGEYHRQCRPICLLNERIFSILSTSPVSTEIYSWGRRLLATNLGRLKAIVSFPRYAVGIEIEDAWGSMSDCTYKGIERPEQLCGVEQLSLPRIQKAVSFSFGRRLQMQNISGGPNYQPL